MVRSQNVFDHRFDEAGLANISDQQAKDLAGAELQDGDVLLNITGDGVTFGRGCLVPSHVLPACVNQHVMLIRTDSTLCHSGYLAAWLALQDSKAYIESFNAGGSRRAITKGHIESFNVPLPPLDIQQGIADLAAALNGRIELLRQTNATLESIAQALFKSWFIDFDPVRAKVGGREPECMDAAVAKLFPAEFHESAMGRIPKGWKVGDVYEVAQVTYGAPFASKLFNSEGDGLPLVRIRDLKDEAPGVWTPEVHPKGYRLRPGDIVVGMDGEFRAYLWGGEEAWMNQRICVFKPVNGHSAAFVRCAIAAPLAHIEATETATTVIHLGKGDIDRFRIVVPPPDVASAFSAISEPLYERIVAGKQNARTLSKLRDALLPRLISGKLRSAEAEAQLNETFA
ncbi:hypothetical protein WI23_02770 [Burkholderia oklahomensis C6786]|nr:hypothetical protein WI23_02770 [Burkholderia oklahomensis C6786]KUY65281.1 hypothetical protein WI23_04340 [Burkholderia oklahomensis C6786]